MCIRVLCAIRRIRAGRLEHASVTLMIVVRRTGLSGIAVIRFLFGVRFGVGC